MALGICCAGTGNKVKPTANGVSSFLAPDCFPSPQNLCNSCKNTSAVWSVRLNLPYKVSQYSLILQCWIAQSCLRINRHITWIAVTETVLLNFFLKSLISGFFVFVFVFVCLFVLKRNFTLSSRLECSGAVSTHCSLHLLCSSSPPASATRLAGQLLVLLTGCRLCIWKI